jgi:Protein of unknown function (DUF1376)
MRWYKRDPDAWRAGVIGLSPEQRGIYDTVIEVLYSYNGELPKTWDEKCWARECNCNPRTWRKNRDELLAMGKLYHEPSGQLMAKRVRMEVERWSNAQRIVSELNLKRQKKQDLRLVDADSLTRTRYRKILPMERSSSVEPKQEVAEKKKRPDEISRQDLEAVYAAKRAASEE